jgi:hypothetical protein
MEMRGVGGILEGQGWKEYKRVSRGVIRNLENGREG